MRNAICLLIVGISLVSIATAQTDAEKRAARRTPIVRVFEQCRDAVVNISTTRVVRMRSLGFSGLWDDIFDLRGPRHRDRRVQSVGSGVVVHESGFIVTNAHVISQASDVQVTFADGTTRPADVIAVDSQHDLAVLKVNARGPLAFQKLGRSNDIMIGETVVAVGNPLGLQHSVSAGIVSALDRELEFGPDVAYTGLIQTDAPINPGNSGGPLLNVNGELIGINTAIRGDAQNIGFAIPVDQLWELLPKMLDIERRQRVRFGLRVSGSETRVLDVRPESPAARAELQPGDRVVAFNGEMLRDGIDYYVHLLNQEAGSDVRLTIERNERRRETNVTLESIPLPDGQELALELLGMELEEISPTMRQRYDLPDYAGLIVVGVTNGGAADRVGMRTSDLILRIDRIPVVTLEDVGLALEQMSSGEHIMVEGLRIDARRPFFWQATLRTDERRR